MKLIRAEMKFEGMRTVVRVEVELHQDFEVELRREYDHNDLFTISKDIVQLEAKLDEALRAWETV